MNAQLKHDLLTTLTAHFPFTYQEVEAAYDFYDSLDLVIQAAEIAIRNAVPLTIILQNSHALNIRHFDSLIDGLGLSHIQELWEGAEI